MENRNEKSTWQAILAASFLLVSLGILFFFIAENYNLIRGGFVCVAAAGILALVTGIVVYLQQKWAFIAVGLVMAATGIILIVRSIMGIINAFPPGGVFDLASGSLILVILPLGISLIAVGITFMSGGKINI